MKHFKNLVLAASAVGALIAPAVAAAAPSTVTFRAEGSSATLVPETTLTTTTATVNKDGKAGHDCTGTSAAGALEQATGGDWSGSWFDGSGYFVTTIKGETPSQPPDFADFFTLFVNGKESQTGICGTELQTGDDVLIYVARCEVGPAPDFACQNPPVLPLVLQAPATATRGQAFTVTVVEQRGNGTSARVAGATVAGDGVSVTTGADGVATISADRAGDLSLQATKAGRARSAVERTCLTTGDDGFCGTTAPPGATPPPPGAAGGSSAPPPAAGAVTRGRIGTVDEGASFVRGRAPRRLAGSVPAFAGGVDRIRLRLTRTDRGRCSTYDGQTERLRRIRCGAANGEWFTIGDRADWEYQLPFALPRGRWVLDLEVRDKQGRLSRLERGNTRVVFTVR